MGLSARTIAEQHTWISKANNYLDIFESSVQIRI